MIFKSKIYFTFIFLKIKTLESKFGRRTIKFD